MVELVYLTKDLGIRSDLTQESLYSLSPSTTRVIEKLEEPLIIEAYFSDATKIPGYYKAPRRKIEDLLDEYQKIGKGKVKLVKYDPLEDQRIKEKANNLGIQGVEAQDIKDDSASTQLVYQGLRLRYGGDRQKVLPLVQNPLSLESELTPKIRELVLAKKPKVGLFIRPFKSQGPMGQQQREPGFRYIEQSLKDRYEVTQVNLSDGKLLAEDLVVLVVVQPQNLSDWEKYAIDQHVMHGGNLCVFQDVADYSVDAYNSFMKKTVVIDAPDSKLKWFDQLGSYGIFAKDELVSDYSQLQLNAALVVQGAGGMGALRAVRMPFWFQVAHIDWSQAAPGGGKDQNLYATFTTGLDNENPILKATRQLSFFWASEVGLKDPMPKGIQGKVLARSSPAALAEKPMYRSSPLEANFVQERYARVQKAQRRQYPLMALVSGTFDSAFKGRSVPTPPGKKDENGGLLQGTQKAPPPAPNRKIEASGNTPSGTPSGSPSQGAGKAAQGKSGSASSVQGKVGPAKKATGSAKGKPDADASQVGRDDQGKMPPLPTGPGGAGKTQLPGPPAVAPGAAGQAGGKADKKPEEKLPPRMDRAKKEARILVCGDASLIRDDFLVGVGPLRQPSSQGGLQFFNNMLDWIALDTDLIELRNRRSVDRSMKFAKLDVAGGETPEQLKERVGRKKSWIRILNILLPLAVLVGLGAVTFLVRAGQKHRFLDEVQGR